MTAAVDLAAKTTPRTLELAPAVMRDGVQRPAVLAIRWREVASAAEKRAAEAASAMAEAVAVMVVAATAAVAGRRSRQSDLWWGRATSRAREVAVLPCASVAAFIPSKRFWSHLRSGSCVFLWQPNFFHIPKSYLLPFPTFDRQATSSQLG